MRSLRRCLILAAALALGAIGVFTDKIGPMPTNRTHALFLDLGVGFAGYAFARLEFPGRDLLYRRSHLFFALRKWRHGNSEAAEGGPIGLVHEGDIVNIDLSARKLGVDVSDEELAIRKTGWQHPAPKYQRGWLARYTKLVTNASNGAILE